MVYVRTFIVQYGNVVSRNGPPSIACHVTDPSRVRTDIEAARVLRMELHTEDLDGTVRL